MFIVFACLLVVKIDIHSFCLFIGGKDRFS